MTTSNLTFSVISHKVAPSYAVPNVDLYQSQKNIHVISSTSVHPFCSKTEYPERNDIDLVSRRNFYKLRLETALGFATAETPCYFPGAVIPSHGGADCSEVMRGNLCFDQFLYLLNFDAESAARLSRLLINDCIPETKPASAFICEEVDGENWPWTHIQVPRLQFLHQADGRSQTESVDLQQVLAVFTKNALKQLEKIYSQDCLLEEMERLLSLIAYAWFHPVSGQRPVSLSAVALKETRASLLRYKNTITAANVLPFLFELEAMASHLSLSEKNEVFAHGVFAGNYIEVALAPITTIKATEFCIGERLFAELINLTSRGFAPVIINEYGLVADGNHRLTASYIWNILKYTRDIEWCLDTDLFQNKVASFAEAVRNGLLGCKGEVSPVSLHQALSHLASFLCRPDWRARLNSCTRTLLKRHDYIQKLPVLVLPEYLSGAVVKSHYDDGISTWRACPSIYEALSLNDHLVLPPRASYHFTDAALLPWFTILKRNCGAYGPKVLGQPQNSSQTSRRISG